MNNLNKALKKSKSIHQKKQENIKNELKKFREIKENINSFNKSFLTKKRDNIAPLNQIQIQDYQNFENLSHLLSPSKKIIIF